MKIILVTLRFDAPGGVEQNVREVAKGLRGAGEEVTVYASDLYAEDRWERRTDFAPVVDGVPVERFPVYKRLIPGLTMPLWTGLVPALSRSGATVVHAHSHRYGHVLQAAAFSRSSRVPLVVSTHYHPADQRESSAKRGALRIQDHLFGMTAYRIASALVVESDLEARLVSEFAPRALVRKIPPGSTSPSGRTRSTIRPSRVSPTASSSTPVGWPRTRGSTASCGPSPRSPTASDRRSWR